MDNEYGIEDTTFFDNDQSKNFLDLIWNNVFAHSLIPDDKALETPMTVYIRVANLIKLSAEANPNTETIEGIRKILSAHILYPEEVFPIDLYIEPEEEPSEPPSNEAESAASLYININGALKELDQWYYLKIKELERDFPLPDFPALDEEATEISPEMQDYIDALNELNNNINQLDVYESPYATQIGSSFEAVINEIGENDFIGRSKKELKLY